MNSNLLKMRCRPALGTFVEIGVIDGSEGHFCLGFNEISRLEEKLSRFSNSSDVSKCNQAKVGDIISISKDLYSLLQFSISLENKSNSAFSLQSEASLLSLEDSIELLPSNKIRILSPLKLDLGGIAKGYIVDSAAKYLSEGGASGIINAGGDLKTFGDYKTSVHLRSSLPPFMPSRIVELDANQALASSGGEITKTSRSNSILRNMGKIEPSFPAVSLLGDSATICDALTKVVAILREKSFPLLRSFNVRLIAHDIN